jgi:hypothetical protein
MDRRELLLGSVAVAGMAMTGSSVATDLYVGQALGVIELVRFRLKKGISTEVWLKANEEISEWVKRQSGFRFRNLSETEGGEWIDVVYWDDKEAAEKANERAMKEIGAFSLIDENSMVMSHGKSHVMLRASTSYNTTRD